MRNRTVTIEELNHHHCMFKPRIPYIVLEEFDYALRGDLHNSDCDKNATEWSRIPVNGRTAKIEVDELVKFLKYLQKYLPFTKIKLKANYELTEKELYERSIQK